MRGSVDGAGWQNTQIPGQPQQAGQPQQPVQGPLPGTPGSPFEGPPAPDKPTGSDILRREAIQDNLANPMVANSLPPVTPGGPATDTGPDTRGLAPAPAPIDAGAPSPFNGGARSSTSAVHQRQRTLGSCPRKASAPAHQATTTLARQAHCKTVTAAGRTLSPTEPVAKLLPA